jgi:hypothetical protein
MITILRARAGRLAPLRRSGLTRSTATKGGNGVATVVTPLPWPIEAAGMSVMKDADGRAC